MSSLPTPPLFLTPLWLVAGREEAPEVDVERTRAPPEPVPLLEGQREVAVRLLRRHPLYGGYSSLPGKAAISADGPTEEVRECECEVAEDARSEATKRCEYTTAFARS